MRKTLGDIVYCRNVRNTYLSCKEGKSVASFCHQVAAWVPDMFCNFYFVKNHKIVKNSRTTKARVKISTDLESFKFYNFYACIIKRVSWFKSSLLLRIQSGSITNINS